MFRSTLARTKLGVMVLALSACVTMPGAAAAPPLAAPALPTPFDFVSNLDLECFRTDPYVPPLSGPIVTRHLNPVLAQLPTEAHTLGPREQLCVPVAKNGRIPPPAVLQFIQHVDLACYRIQGQTLNYPLSLRHLNPVFQGVPAKNTTLVTPEQLCLPVIKNGMMPPPEVLRLVSHIDLKCYRVGNQSPLNAGLVLSQLNPLLVNLPRAQVSVRESRQLCVPVQKNNQAIPQDVLNIVRWIDMEKYDIFGTTVPTMSLVLSHINPLLVNLPREQAIITGRHQLMLPVAKNNVIPPR